VAYECVEDLAADNVRVLRDPVRPQNCTSTAGCRSPVVDAVLAGFTDGDKSQRRGRGVHLALSG